MPANLCKRYHRTRSDWIGKFSDRSTQFVPPTFAPGIKPAPESRVTPRAGMTYGGRQIQIVANVGACWQAISRLDRIYRPPAGAYLDDWKIEARVRHTAPLPKVPLAKTRKIVLG